MAVGCCFLPFNSDLLAGPRGASPTQHRCSGTSHSWQAELGTTSNWHSKGSSRNCALFAEYAGMVAAEAAAIQLAMASKKYSQLDEQWGELTTIWVNGTQVGNQRFLRRCNIIPSTDWCLHHSFSDHVLRCCQLQTLVWFHWLMVVPVLMPLLAGPQLSTPKGALKQPPCHPSC